MKEVTARDCKEMLETKEMESKYEFDVIAICAPAYASGKFLKDLDSELADTLSRLAISVLIFCFKISLI